MTAMFCIPLLVEGLDRILDGGKPHLFILCVFFSGLNGFYFLYMETLFLIAYGLVQVYSRYGARDYFRGALSLGMPAAKCYCVGLMMSAVVLLPTVLYFLGSSRAGNGHFNAENLWRFDWIYYVDFFTRFISGRPSDAYLNVSAVSFAAVFWLLCGKTRYSATRNYKTRLLILLAIVSLTRLVPAGGYVMNGFGYISTRWMFLFSFVNALILVHMLPEIFNLAERRWIATMIAALGYGTIAIFNARERSAYSLLGFAMLSLTVACLGYARGNSGIEKSKRWPVKETLFLSLLVINLSANAHFVYANNVGGYAKEFGKAGEIWKNYPPAPLETKINSGDFFRTNVINSFLNAPVLLGYGGTGIFVSMNNANVSALMSEMENTYVQREIIDLDNWTILNALASVRYAVLSDSGKLPFLPYGYEPLKTAGGDGMALYVNRHELPFGFTYSKVLSEAAYQALNPLQKQEAMLQAVVLPESAYTDVRELHFNSRRLQYNVIKKQNIEWERGVLDVKKDNGSLTLKFDGEPNSETYIRLTEFSSDAVQKTNVTFSGNTKKRITARFWRDFLYSPAHNRKYLVTMGHSKNPQTEATLTFARRGKYRLEDIGVYCLPMNDYPAQAEALRHETLTKVAMGTNKVTGEISLESGKYLFLSIPYDSGWSARVDGKPAPLLKANTAFMALPLTKGRHVIELSYFTPGLAAGIVISLIGFGIFAVIVRKERGKERVLKC
jgi:uncharacterized membrane protein YfhO